MQNIVIPSWPLEVDRLGPGSCCYCSAPAYIHPQLHRHLFDMYRNQSWSILSTFGDQGQRKRLATAASRMMNTYYIGISYYAILHHTTSYIIISHHVVDINLLQARSFYPSPSLKPLGLRHLPEAVSVSLGELPPRFLAC